MMPNGLPNIAEAFPQGNPAHDYIEIVSTLNNKERLAQGFMKYAGVLGNPFKILLRNIEATVSRASTIPHKIKSGTKALIVAAGAIIGGLLPKVLWPSFGATLSNTLTQDSSLLPAPGPVIVDNWAWGKEALTQLFCIWVVMAIANKLADIIIDRLFTRFYGVPDSKFAATDAELERIAKKTSYLYADKNIIPIKIVLGYLVSEYNRLKPMEFNGEDDKSQNKLITIWQAIVKDGDFSEFTAYLKKETTDLEHKLNITPTGESLKPELNVAVEDFSAAIVDPLFNIYTQDKRRIKEELADIKTKIDAAKTSITDTAAGVGSAAAAVPGGALRVLTSDDPNDQQMLADGVVALAGMNPNNILGFLQQKQQQLTQELAANKETLAHIQTGQDASRDLRRVSELLKPLKANLVDAAQAVDPMYNSLDAPAPSAAWAIPINIAIDPSVPRDAKFNDRITRYTQLKTIHNMLKQLQGKAVDLYQTIQQTRQMQNPGQAMPPQPGQQPQQLTQPQQALQFQQFQQFQQYQQGAASVSSNQAASSNIPMRKYTFDPRYPV